MIHCWVSLSKKCICRFNDFHGTQTLHNSKICQCLLFHESDKQNLSCTQLYKSIPSVKEAIAIVILWLHSALVVSQAKLRPTRPARMGSTSHWSHELNLCRLQVLIMHGPYLVTSTTVHSLYRLWVACLVFHVWSQVAMCALTWVIFTLSSFHTNNGLSGKMLANFVERDGLVYRRWVPPAQDEEMAVEQIVLPKECRRTVLHLPAVKKLSILNESI